MARNLRLPSNQVPSVGIRFQIVFGFDTEREFLCDDFSVKVQRYIQPLSDRQNDWISEITVTNDVSTRFNCMVLFLATYGMGMSSDILRT